MRCFQNEGNISGTPKPTKAVAFEWKGPFGFSQQVCYLVQISTY